MVNGKRHTSGRNVGAHGVHGVHGEEELTGKLTFLEEMIAKLQKLIEEKDKIIADLFKESKEAEEEAEKTYRDSKEEMKHYKQRIADTVNDGFRKALRLQWTQRHQWRGRTELFPPDAFPNADLEGVGKKCVRCRAQEVLPLEPLDSNGICDECADQELRENY